MPKINPILAIVIIGILAAIIGGIIWWQCQQPVSKVLPINGQVEQPETQQNVPEQAELSGWKTYTNEEYGFSFKYPNNWYSFEKNEQAEKMCQAEFKVEGPNEFPNNDCLSKYLIVYFSNINGFCTKGGCVGPNLERINKPILNGININKMSLSEITQIKNRLLDPKIANIVEKKEIVKDGVTMSYFYTKQEGGMEVAVFWNFNNNNFYMYAAEEGGGTTKIEEKQIFDQILSTFKFTN